MSDARAALGHLTSVYRSCGRSLTLFWRSLSRIPRGGRAAVTARAPSGESASGAQEGAGARYRSPGLVDRPRSPHTLLLHPRLHRARGGGGIDALRNCPKGVVKRSHEVLRRPGRRPQCHVPTVAPREVAWYWTLVPPGGQRSRGGRADARCASRRPLAPLLTLQRAKLLAGLAHGLGVCHESPGTVDRRARRLDHPRVPRPCVLVHPHRAYPGASPEDHAPAAPATSPCGSAPPQHAPRWSVGRNLTAAGRGASTTVTVTIAQ